MSTITETVTQAIGSLGLRGSTHPIQRNKTLDIYDSFEVTPVIGHEFASNAQLSKIVHDDDQVQDLAVLVSQRGVVFFRGQDINLADQKTLGRKLGKVGVTCIQLTIALWESHRVGSAYPSHHRGGCTQGRSNLSVCNSPYPADHRISSERRTLFNRRDQSKLASIGWHSDITFEPVPSDYAILKLHTNPPTGGDTLWASAYEAYSRLSPAVATLLEGLSAYHEAKWFKDAAEAYGNKVREEVRGHPLNEGEALEAVHPVVRVNPVTGWKGLFVNKEFTKRILGVTKDESDILLDYLFVSGVDFRADGRNSSRTTTTFK